MIVDFLLGIIAGTSANVIADAITQRIQGVSEGQKKQIADEIKRIWAELQKKQDRETIEHFLSAIDKRMALLETQVSAQWDILNARMSMYELVLYVVLYQFIVGKQFDAVIHIERPTLPSLPKSSIGNIIRELRTMDSAEVTISDAKGRKPFTIRRGYTSVKVSRLKGDVIREAVSNLREGKSTAVTMVDTETQKPFTIRSDANARI